MKRVLRFLGRYPVAIVTLICGLPFIVSAVAVLGYQDLQVISTPGNPAAGFVRFFSNSSGLGCLTSSGGNCLTATPSGSAGGDLSGTYPNPGVAQVNGAAVPASAGVVGSNSSRQLIAANAAGVYGLWSGSCSSSTFLRGDGSCAAPSGAPSGSAGGDLSGTYPNPTVAQVNGAVVPTSAALLASNVSKQLVAAVASNVYGLWSGSCSSSTYLRGDGACATPSGGFSNPMTTLGDVIVGGSSGTPQRLAVGSNTSGLVANSGATYGVNWATCPGVGTQTALNLLQFPFPITTASNWNNYTIGMLVPAGQLINSANTWKLGLNISSGSAHIGAAVVLRTLPFSSSFIDSTAITWGSSSTPTLSAGLNLSDAISKTIDASHDYYFYIWYDTNAVNSSLALPQANNIGQMLNSYGTGNHTTDSTNSFFTGNIKGAVYGFAQLLWQS
jgi:hypothetical protein